MRQLVTLAGCLMVACHGVAPRSLPIAPVGEGAADLVLDGGMLSARHDADRGCWRVTDPTTWRELRQRLGGEVATLGADYAAFEVEQVVVIVEPGGQRLHRVEVASEEGVDVVTLVLVSGEVAPGWTKNAHVLRLDRRPNQLAIVLQNLSLGTEATVGVFDGL